MAKKPSDDEGAGEMDDSFTDDEDGAKGGFDEDDASGKGEEAPGEDEKEEQSRTVPDIHVELPAERWSLQMVLGSDISEALPLIDVKQLFDTYMVIKKKFFDDLIAVAPTIRHYSVGKAIDAVTGTDTKDWTRNSWVLVMAKEAKTMSGIWLLFKRSQDQSGALVAIGPEPFAEAVMKSFPEDPEGRNEYIKKILIWITVEPARWKNVGIFIPNWV